tara:strand:- start:2996 stop:3211 length:216 start_codon:yes stop_codon:yes gene_type:complete
MIVDEEAPIAQDDALLIRLDPHLRVLRTGFALPDVTAGRGQLDLFSLPNLQRADCSKAPGKAAEFSRRRSA